MNEDQNPPHSDPLPYDPVPGDGVAPAAMDGMVAERYVSTELKKARGSLLRTQLFSGVFVLLIGGYVFYVTNRFRQSLEPREAATIAQGLISQRVDDQGIQLADYVKKEVPAYIRSAPDYALKELPGFRTQIEDRIQNDIETYAKQSSDRLGTEVDTFLEKNKESVGALIKDGQDPAATAKMTGEMRALFVRYLSETNAGGESLKAKLDGSLDALKRAETRMARLATAKDLTPQEKNAKRAIAVLLRTVHMKRMETGGEPLVKVPAEVTTGLNPTP